MPEKPAPLQLLRPSWVQQLPRLRVHPLPKGETACLHGSGALGTTPETPRLFMACLFWAMRCGGSVGVGPVRFSR